MYQRLFENPFGRHQRDFCFLVYCLFILSGCNQELQKTKAEDFKIQIQGEAQGTTYSIVYYDLQERNIKPQIDSILDRIDRSVSTYREGSLINAWNSSKNGMPIDDYFMDLIMESWIVSSATNGAFDPTIKPLVSYWGFGPEKFEDHDMADTAKIRQLRSLVNVDTLRVIVRDDTFRFADWLRMPTVVDSVFLYKPISTIQLDFNAIGQGWSVDVVSNYIRSLGIDVFFMEIGGEIVAGKPKPNGDLWRFGIDKPESDLSQRDMQAVISLRNRALATSGNYRKFYVKDGIKYSHTISPETGLPVDHSLLSATVVSSSAAEADAMATAFMVMGKDSTINYINDHPYLGNQIYLIFDSAGLTKTYISNQLQTSVEETE